MNSDIIILLVEAMAVYFLVIWTHGLRNRVGMAPFYVLLGGITAIMSWVTDAGVKVEMVGITFMVGSTVFYTALLLGVFVVYVFDGPKITHVAILTIAGVSIIVPLIAMALHMQMVLTGHPQLSSVPVPSLRINSASVIATVVDLLFLGIAWEFLGRSNLHMRLGIRAFLVLLGVMWLDVVLFATLAFAGEPGYTSIVTGTLSSRLIISLLASPFLYIYLNWQHTKKGIKFENRPILAILKEMANMHVELSMAQQEIERRKKLEAVNEQLIQKLRESISHATKLEGLLPICSSCKRIRIGPQQADESNTWLPLEEYVRTETSVKFSHGICLDCMKRLYPDYLREGLFDGSEGNEANTTEPTGDDIT